jgi:hypothetical protein
MRSLLGHEKAFERLSPRETLRRAAHDNVSISRFGNGELRFCLKRASSRFQPFLPAMNDRLLRALYEPKDGVLTCYSNSFRDTPAPEWIVRYNPQRYDSYRTVREPNDIGVHKRSAEYRAYAARWNTIARRTKIRTWGDTNLFRLAVYVPEYAAGKMGAVLDDVCRLFEGKRILFVTAKEPHYGGSYEDKARELAILGVKAADFIEVPAVGALGDADRVEREILAKCRGMTDVFLQAGPLATVLAYELAGRIDARLIDSGALNAQVSYLVEHVEARATA